MREVLFVLIGSLLLSDCGISRQEAVKMDNEITLLRGQLTDERNKAKTIEEQLNTLLPPPLNQPIPINEICAVPEVYLGKEITINGRLVQSVFFSEPFTQFRLFDRACVVFCAFVSQELDPQARRELSSLNDRESVNLSGRLVQNRDGLLKDLAISGYHFIVTKVHTKQ